MLNKLADSMGERAYEIENLDEKIEKELKRIEKESSEKEKLAIKKILSGSIESGLSDLIKNGSISALKHILSVIKISSVIKPAIDIVCSLI